MFYFCVHSNDVQSDDTVASAQKPNNKKGNMIEKLCISIGFFFLAFVNQLFGRWGSLNVPRNIIGNWIKVHALVTCVVSILIMRISQLCLIQIYSVRCLGETKISGSFDAGYLRTVAGWLEWEKSGSSNTIERKRKFISHWNSSKCDLVSGCSTGKSRHVWLKNLRR